MKKTTAQPEYPAFLAAMKERILQSRSLAAIAVNRELVALYWDIGQGIAEKQRLAGWGDSVVERLAADLRSEFPDMQGFSIMNVWRMRQLYLIHTADDFLSQAVRELGISRSEKEKLSQAVRDLVTSVPWGHHANVLAKVTDSAARLYYLRATARFGWSRNVLLNQIKIGAYKPEHAGKMDFYLNVLNDKERSPDDNPSIGIILCAEKKEKKPKQLRYPRNTKLDPQLIGAARTNRTGAT